MWRRSPLLLLLAAAPAQASFLDSDFWCRTYGCAVVHDGTTYDIYDNWQFASSTCCVPVGGEMIDYYTRAGAPNVTGTLDRAGPGPGAGQSQMLEVVDGTGTYAVVDDGDGYLDVADAVNAFTLTPDTDINVSGRRYSHSFFISSRNTAFSVRALAQVSGRSGELGDTVGLGDIKLTPNLSVRGRDGDFQYGAKADARNAMIVTGIDDLGDLASRPTQVFEFRDDIRRSQGDIDKQSIRLDFMYELPAYDMSMGAGALEVDVVFDFYRE